MKGVVFWELIGAMCWPTVEKGGGAIRGQISSFIKYNTIKEGGRGYSSILIYNK